jgi:hypothetical protein
MRAYLIAPLGFALLAAACGDTRDQRTTAGATSGATSGSTVASGGDRGPTAMGTNSAAQSGSAGTRPSEDPSIASAASSPSSGSGSVNRGSAAEPAASAASRPSENPSSSMAAARDNPSARARSDATSRASANANMSSAQLRQAQTELRNTGLYDGPIDGIWGPRTRAAVGKFQAQNNLPQTYALDNRTMRQLQSRTGTAGNRVNPPGSQIGETPRDAEPMSAPPVGNRQSPMR